MPSSSIVTDVDFDELIDRALEQTTSLTAAGYRQARIGLIAKWSNLLVCDQCGNDGPLVELLDDLNALEVVAPDVDMLSDLLEDAISAAKAVRDAGGVPDDSQLNDDGTLKASVVN